MSGLYQAMAEASFAAPTAVPGRHRREEDDAYPCIARVNAKLRVIECKDKLQWIVQRLVGNRWRGISFHRDRDALINRSGATGAALTILQALPPTHLGDSGLSNSQPAKEN